MARILVVDDEPLLRETLRLALTSAGHTVTVAPNGRAGLVAIEADQTIELVVTDILMPETDGLELIMRLRKSGRRLRVIAISGGGRTHNMDVLDFAQTFGADMVLSKPFEPAKLISAVAEIVAVSA